MDEEVLAYGELRQLAKNIVDRMTDKERLELLEWARKEFFD